MPRRGAKATCVPVNSQGRDVAVLLNVLRAVEGVIAFNHDFLQATSVLCLYQKQSAGDANA
jgi:hypothetical protein